MPSPSSIPDVLRRDKIWNIFALADLYPPHDTHSHWTSNDSAVVLRYEAVDPPVLFAYGEGTELQALLSAVNQPKLFLHMKLEAVDLLKERYQILWERKMWRMYLSPDVAHALVRAASPLLATPGPERSNRGVETSPLSRLCLADLPDLQALYADGAETGESPNFFYPSMLDTGEFRGLRENGSLVAVAGTHVVEPAESIGVIGNVYTHRHFRGRGFGEIVTAAVIEGLRARGISTIALNVTQSNLTAIRIYERLGFVRYCEYLEGEAETKSTP